MDFLRSRPAWPGWALAAVLALAWFAYRPGLAGGFLFDDFVNLPSLGGMGPIDDAAAFWRYVTSGTADPTGRPVALLSFLVDARDWPAQPGPFLQTNLLLHLLNGALLFLLLRALGRRLDGPSTRTDAAAVIGAGIWVLHPLFVSTTLYIVQREAMLPATFALCGLLAWVHGRTRFASAPTFAIAWMVGGLGLCTVLAVLSKANGALLPLLAWVVDAVLLRPSDPPALRANLRLRAVRGSMLVVPSVLLFAWLASKLVDLHVDLASRSWTIGERLLTEPRVLVDYLQLLAVPRVLSTGLYNDAYVASTGLFDPRSTLPAILAILALVVAAFAWRRRAPALACALLFFFAGHLLESTVIALELYFEHRNYLPALLLGWPLARAIVHWQTPVRVRALVAIALLSLLAVITWQRASLWARQDEMAMLWAAQNPDSSRAQATAAIFETKAGHADRAVARLDARANAKTGDLQLVLNRASALCSLHGLSGADGEAVATALRTATEGDQMVHRWLSRSLDSAEAKACPGIDIATVDRWLAAARANPRLRAMPGRQQDLHSLAGRLALAQRRPAQALVEFDRALDAWTTPQAALQQAGMLATTGCYAQALAHLDHFDTLTAQRRAEGWNMQRVHAFVLDRQDFWPRELATLRGRIEDDLRTNGQGTCAR